MANPKWTGDPAWDSHINMRKYHFIVGFFGKETTEKNIVPLYKEVTL